MWLSVYLRQFSRNPVINEPYKRSLSGTQFPKYNGTKTK